MEKFKMKTVMPGDGSKCKVQIIQKHGELSEDNWGNKRWGFTALINGEKLYWEASETALKGIKDCGSPNFWIQRWDKGGKTGFNYLLENDAALNVEPAQTVAPKDETQERIIRGMCFNNACHLAKSPDNVKSLTLDLYDHMSHWLRSGEVNTSPEATEPKKEEEPPLPDEPPPESEDFDPDLPF